MESHGVDYFIHVRHMNIRVLFGEHWAGTCSRTVSVQTTLNVTERCPLSSPPYLASV